MEAGLRSMLSLTLKVYAGLLQILSFERGWQDQQSINPPAKAVEHSLDQLDTLRNNALPEWPGPKKT